MAVFTFSIESRTAKFGEDASQERVAVADLLSAAAARIAGHTAPFAGQNVPEAGNQHEDNCSYAFGPGSLNGSLNGAL